MTVHVFRLGFKGAALSASVSMWISFIMLAIYVKCSDKFRYTWNGFTAEALQHVIPCMKLAVPSAVMVWLAAYSLFSTLKEKEKEKEKENWVCYFMFSNLCFFAVLQFRVLGV